MQSGVRENLPAESQNGAFAVSVQQTEPTCAQHSNGIRWGTTSSLPGCRVVNLEAFYVSLSTQDIQSRSSSTKLCRIFTNMKWLELVLEENGSTCEDQGLIL